MSDTLDRTLARSLKWHPYSDTLNRPTSIANVAATIPLAGNTQLPTDSAEEPFSALPQNLWVRNDCHTKWNGLSEPVIVQDSHLIWAGLFRLKIIWPSNV